jgi:hypothetical protein
MAVRRPEPAVGPQPACAARPVVEEAAAAEARKAAAQAARRNPADRLAAGSAGRAD